MDGIEAIIQKILSDAESQAKDTLSKAEEYVRLKVNDAENWANDYKAYQDKILQKEAEETVTRRLTVADLDVRKILLEAKSQVVNEVFENALEKLRNLDKDSYLKLVEKLIEENAEEGDEVVLSSDSVISSSDMKKLKVFVDRGLKISSFTMSERGGVMLIGKKSDKNLTFSAVLEDMKSGFISSIALKMFGEN